MVKLVIGWGNKKYEREQERRWDKKLEVMEKFLRTKNLERRTML